MSNKPIFCATHPRACSTAFERVFMTRRDTLQCLHEPFGDAFYFGPERLGDRYADNEKVCIESGFSESTYKTILDRINRENTEGKRLFIKDMVYYLVPPNQKSVSIAPSLLNYKFDAGASTTNGTAATNGTDKSKYPFNTPTEEGNPTVMPTEILSQFHFTFLIRHPRSSVPSYYRCTIPPLDEITGFYNFMPSETGLDELRRFFDYLCNIGQVGPNITGQDSESNQSNGDKSGTVDICVIDADDLLDDPEGIVKAYCRNTGLDYSPQMLKWDTEEDHQYAKDAFEKWKGFHDDAINSTDLKPRAHKKAPKSDEQLFTEWTEKYGKEAAELMRSTVEANVADYEYLKQFAIKV